MTTDKAILTVKPLEWSPYNGDAIVWNGGFREVEKAHTPFRTYFIASIDDLFRVEFGSLSPEGIGLYGTLDDAKAAAQSDYETRIISALSHTNQKTEGEDVDPPAPVPHVRPITLDVLRDYFKAMDAGDVPDQALALYSYLLMDGFIDKGAAKANIRAALSPSPSPNTRRAIRQLRWDDKRVNHQALGPFGFIWYVTKSDDFEGYTAGRLGDFDTLAEAKAAVQAHFEKGILAAFDEAPPQTRTAPPISSPSNEDSNG